jgi:dihydroorotase
LSAYVIKGARLASGEVTDLLLSGGIVAETGTGLSGGEVIDATGLLALPGLVDLHTHLRQPGREDAETVESGSRAAALGGYTAVCAMANTDPVADTAGVVEQVYRLGREAGLVDVQPIGAGLLRRRPLCLRPGADAARAGVREGVRRRDRPARGGAAADRGRADERG